MNMQQVSEFSKSTVMLKPQTKSQVYLTVRFVSDLGVAVAFIKLQLVLTVGVDMHPKGFWVYFVISSIRRKPEFHIHNALSSSRTSERFRLEL
ncbi:hypothetical protein AVEN_248132-1 [Araneus ventricosus]|uniref:Uncharacterized protein n=1 Tax=Araneus ventricosus TaxID=182803 RepID=A0A4Y2HVT7_ARAVE|nr:hypothetical protein AVEN_248132-1 [Araneus ventricosus]